MTSIQCTALRARSATLVLALAASCAASAAPAGATRVPFRFHENHIYVEARVNGSRPLTFLLDTGATGSYLDRRHKDLLAPPEGDAPPSATLRIGALDVPGQRFLPASLTFGSYDGVTVDGLLGYDFIGRFALEIDYARRILSLSDPATYRPAPGAVVLPLTLLEDDSGGKLPLVEATVVQGTNSPVSGKFIVDTAVRAGLSFNTPFVDANALLERTPRTIPALVPGGALVKNPDMRLGRVTRAQIGPFVFDDVVAAFSRERSGILAATEFDGVVGSEILSRFRVTFDYARSRMALVPNGRLRDRFDADASGLSIVARVDGRSGLAVHGVVPGSPSAEAGIAAGDTIEAVDGRPVTAASLPRVRALLRVPGRTHRVTVRRDASVRTVRIQLRALL